MNAIRSPLLKLLAFAFVASSLYFSTYLALAQREPVYKFKQLPLLNFNNGIGYAPPLEVKRSDPPDWYRLKYRLSSDWMTWMFAPAHRLDRSIRPAYWPTRRHGC